MAEITLKSKEKELREVVPLVGDALRRELQMIQAGLEKTKQVLKGYEKKNNMSSKKFYQKFLQGKLGDEYIDWAGEYEIFLSLRIDLEKLGSLRVVY